MLRVPERWWPQATGEEAGADSKLGQECCPAVLVLQHAVLLLAQHIEGAKAASCQHRS